MERLLIARRALATLAEVLAEPRTPITRDALRMAQDRNLTVHTCQEALANEIRDRLPGHASLMAKWLDAIEQRLSA